MRMAKISLNVTLLCVGVLFFGLLKASPAIAQPARTCYQLTNINTCVDDPTAYGCSAETTFQGQGDGSFIVSPTKPRFPENNTQIQVWPGKFRITSATGSGEGTWNIPPTIWCSDQNFTASLSVTATGECSIDAAYHNYPVDTIAYTPGPSGSPIGGGVSASGYDNEKKAISQEGVHPATGMVEPWSLSVSLSGTCNKDRQGDWGGATFVAYQYEPAPAGQEPQPGSTAVPPGGAPTSASGQTGGGAGAGNGSEPGSGGSRSESGSSSSGGATNTTLSVPPYGSPEPYSGALGLTLQAGQRRGLNGTLVMLPIWLINANNNVANMNFEMRYDPSVAIPEGKAIQGNMLDGVLLSTNASQSGLMLFGFASVSDLWGTGPVVYVPFRLVGPPGSRTDLNLTVTTINNAAGSVPAIDRIPGEIVVVSPGQETGGDCDGDGHLTSVDALCALKMSVKLRPPIMALDMDKNGSVTSRDATIILQEALRR